MISTRSDAAEDLVDHIRILTGNRNVVEAIKSWMTKQA